MDVAANAPGSTRLTSTDPARPVPESSRLRIDLLGRFRAVVDGREVPSAAWPRKAADLIKLLALSPDGWRDHARLRAELWPTVDPSASVGRLHSTVYVARHILDPGGTAGRDAYLQVHGARVCLRAGDASPWTDVAAFTAAADRAATSREPADYRVAADLYSGDLLPDNPYDDWATGPRERLRARWRAVLGALADVSLDRGDEATALATLACLADADPADETVQLRLMHLHRRRGEREEALHRYQQLRTALRDLRLAPSEQVRQLRRAILDLDAGSPNPAPDAIRATPLPIWATTFVGRADELAELRGLLDAHGLVTLTGPGGCGKTRLALALAREIESGFADGVRFVALDLVSDPANVVGAVGAAFGLGASASASLSTLALRLHDKAGLLVLDNCEHVVGACAALVERLIAAAPAVRVLVTSREPLGLAGEVVWTVPGLSCPPRGVAAPDDLLRADAAQLFVEHARTSRPDFAVTPGNVAAIARICRRLAGMPLAVELAARRVSLLTVEEIARRLGDCLALLGPGPRSAPARQQTLRATLDWSYSLLDEDERVLFRRLAAFAPTWPLEAAEAICADDPLPPFAGEGAGGGGRLARRQILDLLARLVDKSLVCAEPHPGETRYRRLEPTRQYAAEKLAASGEEEAIRCRHATHYLALVEEAEPFLTGPEQAAWLDRLEHSRANLAVALRWLAARGDAERAQRLAGALWRFWHARGTLAEGRRWLERALAVEGAATDARGKALNGAGQLARFQGDFGAAEALFQAALDARRRVGDAARVADSLSNLGYLALLRRDLARAGELFAEAMRLRQELDDRPGKAYSWANLADVARLQGDHAHARRFARRGQLACQAVGNATGAALALTQQARVALDAGEVDEVRALAVEALTRFRALGYRVGEAYARRLLGEALLRRGDLSGADAEYAAALVNRWEAGDVPSVADALTGLAAAALARGRLRHAARLAGAAAALDEPFAAIARLERASDPAGVEASLRARLGHAFAAAWSEGRAAALPRIIAQALEPPPEDEPTRNDPLAVLTPREREIALLLARHQTNREIAEVLGLARRTVDTHVARILRRLDMDRRDAVAELIAHRPEEGREKRESARS